MHKNIKESPDGVYSGNKSLDYDDEDAIAFGYYKKKMYVGDFKQPHWEIADEYGLEIPASEEARVHMKYPGRMWIDKKIISFWAFPKSNSEMKKTISDLEIELYRVHGERIDIWNKFKVEVLVSKEKDDILKKWKYRAEYEEYVPRGYTVKFIPLKSYESSAKRTKKDLATQHLKSPVAKQVDVPADIGSKKTSSGLTPTQKHQMTRTSDGIIKLKTLIEYTIGKVSKQINVKIDIDKTKHAGEQQFRDAGYITDADIIKIVNLSLSNIANMLIFNEIDMLGHILIRQTNTLINIVGQLRPGKNDTIDFIVITVMKKRNFIPKSGTKVIEV